MLHQASPAKRKTLPTMTHQTFAQNTLLTAPCFFYSSCNLSTTRICSRPSDINRHKLWYVRLLIIATIRHFYAASERRRSQRQRVFMDGHELITFSKSPHNNLMRFSLFVSKEKFGGSRRWQESSPAPFKSNGRD